ncbi:MAG: Histidinol-phosphate aminotransferase [Bacteroidetes bacterium]|nr:Histidinol-phosphate aminotransferase [Bacteroidota bacterium]
MDIEALIRPNIRRLKPYRSARQDYTSGILLDANENAFGSAVMFDGLELNRYPDPSQKQLRSRIAQLHNVQPENIFVGVGSDEVIDLLIRIFCEPRLDSVVILEPTYGVYRVAADVNDITVNSSLLTDEFQIDPDDVQRTSDANTKLIFCCSPNNPTGNLLRRQDILDLCAVTQAIVVVDEAYVDFAQTESLIGALSQFPNLVVLRTLSKAWGLAAIRLGYALAHPLIVSYLMKAKAPYNINALTSMEALKALERADHVQQSVASTIAERKRLFRELERVACVQRVFPSDANFLLVHVTDARALHQRLAQRGVIVRDRSSEPKLANCIRISVGTPGQNDTLLTALKEFDK